MFGSLFPLATEENGGKKQGDPGKVAVDLPINFASLVSAPTHIKGLKRWNIEVNDTGAIGSIGYSPDGRYLVFQQFQTNTNDVIFQASWDFTKGGLVPPSAFLPPLHDLVTSPDGKRQACRKGNTVELFKVGDKEPYRTVRGLSEVYNYLSSPNHEWLAIATYADGPVAEVDDIAGCRGREAGAVDDLIESLTRRISPVPTR